MTSNDHAHSVLLTPLKLGALTLPNRVIMAPLTRMRAGDERIPNAMMAEYYKQRAGAGLILTEATSVSPMGVGYRATPGIWSEQQVAGWQTVTDAVHAAGGRIFLQLWHVGRISDPDLLGGHTPVSASAIAAAGPVRNLRPVRPHPVPRALETGEVAEVVEEFRQAAENAKRAGFDGVEIHAANGYLIDQFLQDKTNRRTDRYGGPVENRARFLLDIVDAVTPIWGASRMGVHLRPRGEEHDMGDRDPLAIFGYVAEELGKRGLAFIFVRETEGDDSLLGEIKRRFGGPVIANEEMSPGDGERFIERGTADALAFGRDFIATPDLVERIAHGLPFNAQDKETFYGDGPRGYTDYPTWDQLVHQKSEG